MRADTTIAICECEHDVGKHGLTMLSEISGEFSMSGCFDRDCRCKKFKFREGTYGISSVERAARSLAESVSPRLLRSAKRPDSPRTER